MIARSPRLVLGLTALAAAIGLVLVALPDTAPPRADVGTSAAEHERVRGTELVAPAVESDATTSASTPEADAERSEDLVRTDGIEQPTTTTAAPDLGPSTTLTTGPSDTDAPTSTTSTTVPAFVGPDHLRGRLVFLRPDLSPNGLYSSALDGSDVRPEVPCPWTVPSDDYPASLSPDGRWVARLCQRVPMFTLPDFPLGAADLVVQRVDGSETRVLWSLVSPSVRNLVWSPDGGTLAMNWGGELVFVDVGDRSRRWLEIRQPDDSELYVGGQLSWSPDGTQLLMDGPWIIDPETGRARSATPVTWREGTADMTAWTPDGFAFFRFRPHQHYWEVRPAERWVRLAPETEGRVDTLFAGLEPALNGDPSHIVQGPIFFGVDLAMVVIDGQLWRLDIGPAHPYDQTYPIGTLTLVDDDFPVAYPSGTPSASMG